MSEKKTEKKQAEALECPGCGYHTLIKKKQKKLKKLSVLVSYTSATEVWITSIDGEANLLKTCFGQESGRFLEDYDRVEGTEFQVASRVQSWGY